VYHKRSLPAFAAAGRTVEVGVAAETVAPTAAMKRRARNGDMRSKESGPFIIVRRENRVIAMGGFLIPREIGRGVHIDGRVAHETHEPARKISRMSSDSSYCSPHRVVK
jgi:hypothetical protein